MEPDRSPRQVQYRGGEDWSQVRCSHAGDGDALPAAIHKAASGSCLVVASVKATDVYAVGDYSEGAGAAAGLTNVRQAHGLGAKSITVTLALTPTLPAQSVRHVRGGDRAAGNARPRQPARVGRRVQGTAAGARRLHRLGRAHDRHPPRRAAAAVHVLSQGEHGETK